MRKLRHLFPGGQLARARFVASGLAAAALLLETPQLGNELHSPSFIRLSAGAIGALLALLIYVYVRKDAPWWTVPVVPVLVAVAAAGLRDPMAGTGLDIVGLTVLSLYGGMGLWLLRLAGGLVAMPLAMVLSPTDMGTTLHWNSATVLGVLPQVLLMGVLTRGIYLAMLRMERSARREAVLARAGHAMIGKTDAAEVREAGRRAAVELAELSPGVAMLVVRRDGDGLRVTNLAGAPDELRGRPVPPELVADPARFAELLPDHRWWSVDALSADPATAEVLIAVGGRRPVPADVMDAFRTCSNQVVLAEQGCRVHANLDHLAHHDHLTQLPTRAKFFRTLHGALETAGADTVALLNVDLDDFKLVNDRYGHAVGDELLVEVAARLSEASAGRGLAARFGGDEFAVLLTGLAGPGEAVAIADRLADRLAEPVRLTATTVLPGASIGIATAGPGVDVAELTRRADLAMYSAKAAGKRRVETFGPASRMPV